MQLEQYVSQNGHTFHFSRQQASQFAKRVADDFNPIHDVDAKRFCVPGDLLFTVALTELGLQEDMNIRFADMVTENIELFFTSTEAGQHDIRDGADKVYLSIEASGNRSDKREQNLKLAEQYVAFSGKTFPHVLVPLWKEHNVMVNPARPLVIYESMTLSMETLDFDSPRIALSGSSLEVNGKRGNVLLDIEITEKDKVIGRGQKRMLLSGLKPYDQAAIDDLIRFYDQRKVDLA